MKQTILPKDVLTKKTPSTNLFAKTDDARPLKTDIPDTISNEAEPPAPDNTRQKDQTFEEYSAYTKQFLLRIPSNLHREIDTIAGNRKTNTGKSFPLTAWIIEACQEKLKREIKRK